MDEKERQFAEAKFGQRGIGYVEKEVVKGLRLKNVPAAVETIISPKYREQDASRYDNMPVIGDDKDPMLNQKLDDRIDALYEALQVRLPALIALNEKRKQDRKHKQNPSRRHRPKTPKLASGETQQEEEEIQSSVSGTLYGIEHDLSHWDELPGVTAVEKTRYVFTRDNRLRYLIYLLIPLMIVIIIAHGLNN